MNKCPVCSKDFEGVRCPSCGHVLEKGTESAVSITEEEAAAPRKNYRGISDKNKWPALLLCIFLGIFGAHRFYVGKTGTAVVFLLTLGVFGIGWIADIINISIGNFSDRYGRFIQVK